MATILDDRPLFLTIDRSVGRRNQHPRRANDPGARTFQTASDDPARRVVALKAAQDLNRSSETPHPLDLN